MKPPRLPTSTSMFNTGKESQEKHNESLEREVRPNDEISWGEPNSKNQKISQLINNSKNDERRLINEAKVKYLNEIKKRKLGNINHNNGTDGDDELGPTQDVSKVKGIFD